MYICVYRAPTGRCVCSLGSSSSSTAAAPTSHTAAPHIASRRLLPLLALLLPLLALLVMLLCRTSPYRYRQCHCLPPRADAAEATLWAGGAAIYIYIYMYIHII
eukprot:GHVU01096326.1.p5 GENE.GHVU01096326.1~~GHVU01096326.1.p5  ORF type:complete len:104 (+),score=10.44 GHVU01096326.1:79-390(+)